jgi:hypothetical protein
MVILACRDVVVAMMMMMMMKRCTVFVVFGEGSEDGAGVHASSIDHDEILQRL